MIALAASRRAVAARRPSGSSAMKSWPAWLSVNSAGSLRGIGKVLRGWRKYASAISPPLAPRDPDPGMQPRADQGQGVDQVRAAAPAVTTASLPPQLIPASAIGRGGSWLPEVGQVLGHVGQEPAGRGRVAPVEPVGARAPTVGEVGLVARLGEGPAQVGDTSRRGSGPRGGPPPGPEAARPSARWPRGSGSRRRRSRSRSGAQS